MFADVAAIYGGDDRPNFGSGRLIAPNLILTAGHVVDYPRRRNPTLGGWKAALLRDRVEDGSWTASALDAKVVWRGGRQLDLALLKVEGEVELRPTLQPVPASYNGIPPISDVVAVGFPEGRMTANPDRLDAYLAPGVLRIPGQFGPYVWNVPLADKPNRKRGWRGMSGAGVCQFEQDGRLYLFGAVEEVPVHFSHQLQVASLAQAFDDPDFVRLIHAALKARPSMVAFELRLRRRDLGIARNFQFATRAFKNEYLLSETNPVPFGGRNAELRRLDDWLLDPSSCPRMLVTAPAGRGKSALLVHWMKNLEDGGVCGDDGWQLAFMPISIRVGTNIPRVFYRGLASRLAEIMNEEPPSDLGRDADDFRMSVGVLLEKVAESDRGVLVVVDGLDEAPEETFDAAIFPMGPANKNLRVLLSARWQKGDVNSAGWLQRLAWDRNVQVDSFELGTLKKDHIGDVLIKLGAPVGPLGREPALLDRLLVLTGGEPLLVRYYAEDVWDLWKRGATAVREILAYFDTQEPGFNAYFKRWFDEQTKLWKQEDASLDPEDADRALFLLAFALGPLEDADFLALVRRAGGSRRITAIDRMLAPLRRFVIGSGKRGAGYVLSHPRIGQYLQDERFRATAEEARQAFAAWGKASLSDLSQDPDKPERASPYVLQFLAQHFDQIHAPPADYVMMVENGWRRARETFEGGHEGFASDVRRVQSVLKVHARDHARLREPKVGLGGQTRCALCLSSISNVNSNVASDLLALAARYRLLTATQAVTALRLNPSVTWRAEGLIALVPHIDREDIASYASGLLLRLPEDHRESFVLRLVSALPRENRSVALDLASTVDDERTKALLLDICAPALKISEVREALAIARSLGDSAERLHVLRVLALYSALEPGDRREILNEAFSCAKASASLLRLEVTAVVPEQVSNDFRSSLDDALEVARGNSRNLWTALHWAARLPEAQGAILASEALSRFATISDEWEREFGAGQIDPGSVPGQAE